MPRGGHDIPVSGTHLKGTQWLRRVDPTVGHLKGTPWSRRVWTPHKRCGPAFVTTCVPNRWARLRFFCCVIVGKPFKKTVWSRHLFLFYFKGEKQNKKENP